MADLCKIGFLYSVLVQGLNSGSCCWKYWKSIYFFLVKTLQTESQQSKRGNLNTVDWPRQWPDYSYLLLLLHKKPLPYPRLRKIDWRTILWSDTDATSFNQLTLFLLQDKYLARVLEECCSLPKRNGLSWRRSSTPDDGILFLRKIQIDREQVPLLWRMFLWLFHFIWGFGFIAAAASFPK